MILAAALVAQDGRLFYLKYMHDSLKAKISFYGKDFLKLLSAEPEITEITYIETKDYRYVYKQTEDLYWLLATRVESDLFDDIYLMGKLVSTIVDCGPSETTSYSLSEYQKELFYHHAWHPWDGAGPSGYSSLLTEPETWTLKFEQRVQFLIDVTNEHIHESDITYYNCLVEEAWSIEAQVDKIANATSNTDEIDEIDLIEGCRLKCRLEQIRVTINRIQDPYLRLFACRDLMQENIPEDADQTLKIGSEPITFNDAKLDIEARVSKIDFTNEQIPKSDMDYYNSLMKEAWVIDEQLDSLAGPLESDEIDETILIEGCRLKCRLEDIKMEIDKIEDPYLRMFARRDLIQNLNESISQDADQTLQLDQSLKVSSAPSLQELEMNNDACNYDLDL